MGLGVGVRVGVRGWGEPGSMGGWSTSLARAWTKSRHRSVRCAWVASSKGSKG